MKKLLTFTLTMAMMLTLVACGGVDTTMAIDAFNATSQRMDEIGALANPNALLLGDDFMDEMIAIAEDLQGLKTELESDEITQERADEIQAISEEYLVLMDGFEASIEEILADPMVGQLQAISDIIANIFEIYSEAVPLAIDNGWEADAMTVEELNAIGWLMEEAQKETFFDEIAVHEPSEIDEYIDHIQMILDAMPGLLDRVSQPYTDEK